MRSAHCTVALLALALLAAPGHAQTAPAARPADFTVFFQGNAVGAEQVTVARTPQGITITGTERTGPPIGLVARRAEIRYTPDWRPLECVVDGSVRNQEILIRSKVNGTTVETDYSEGGKPGHKTDQIAADALLLPNIFFGGYEALAARLAGTKVGDRLSAYVPPQSSTTISVTGISDDRVRTQDGLVQVRRYTLEFSNPKRPVGVELWTDPGNRLLRFSVPAQGFDVIRSDLASITSRREPISRPNDQQVNIPANGFSLTGTLSQPESKGGKPARLPAIVLVSGSAPTDRDETIAGIPLFGQLASALAEAGFVVLRYDKRGVGQSGGRIENTTVGDYAEDVLAAVKFLQRRPEVDRRRIALIGFGEGGAIAMEAASHGRGVAALVLVNAPGVGGGAFMLEQQQRLLDVMKASDADRRAKIALQQQLQRAALTGRGIDALPPDLRRVAETPWLRSYLAFDPQKTLKKCGQPVLIVQSGRDREVAPGNADRLEAIARARKGRAGQEVTVVRLSGLNHLLVPAPTGEVDEYDHLPDKTISPDVVRAIDTWLNENMRDR